MNISLIIFILSKSASVASAAKKCFAAGGQGAYGELGNAIREYSKNGCGNKNKTCEVTQTYGWPINSWCVKDVTDMSHLPFHSYWFNEDISDWDTSSVTNMDGMFDQASNFNGDLSKWDVSNVRSMDHMFAGSGFNGDISKWDVSSVTYMGNMFYNADFNRNLCEWKDKLQIDFDYYDVFDGADCYRSCWCPDEDGSSLNNVKGNGNGDGHDESSVDIRSDSNHSGYSDWRNFVCLMMLVHALWQ